MKNKVFITGWKGFIGSNLTKYLKDLGYEVDGCDIKEDGESGNFTYYYNDIYTLVHCAAFVSVTESHDYPSKYIENNISDLSFLLQGENIKRVIFLSTGGALYGNKIGAKEEDVNLDKITNPYAMTKLVGEWLIKYYCKDYLILRLANVIGEGQDDRGEANCLTHFRKDNPIVVYGGGMTRDFIDVKKVCKAIEIGIRKEIKGIYNIGSGQETYIDNLALGIAKKRGVNLIYASYRKGEVKNITLDITKAKKVGLL